VLLLLRCLCLICFLGAASGCQPALRLPLYVGIEPVRDGGSASKALSARLLAHLAAMPNIRAVDLSEPRNAWDFASLSATKLRLSTVLDEGPFCVRSSYAVFAAGQEQYEAGLVIPRAETTDERRCIDLYATRLYGDLIRQGL